MAAAADDITFDQFLLSLATAAMMHLGVVEHPEAKEKSVDLVQAKQTIDILGMLRDKTKGNLSTAEQHLLDTMLAELRMRYVQASG